MGCADSGDDDNYDRDDDGDDDGDDDDNDDGDDAAVETEANWSPTGQWHILCYSVT